MKPIIIYTDDEKCVKLSKEDFERYIRESYIAGYNEGHNDGKKEYHYIPYYPSDRYWFQYNYQYNTGTPIIPCDLITCDLDNVTKSSTTSNIKNVDELESYINKVMNEIKLEVL